MNRRTFLQNTMIVAAIFSIGVVERHLCRTLGVTGFYELTPGDKISTAQTVSTVYELPWNTNLYGIPKT